MAEGTGTILTAAGSNLAIAVANVAAARRSRAVVEAFLAGHRPAFRTSDRYGAQAGWATKAHQACLAHLIRDVQYAIDAGDVNRPGFLGG